MKEVEYLGYQLSPTGITITLDKIESVKNCLCPRNVKTVQAFLGFANFCQTFMEGFSRIWKPLAGLLKKDDTLMRT